MILKLLRVPLKLSNANTACWHREVNKVNFYVSHANAAALADWFISTVWRSGTSQRSKNKLLGAQFSIISRNFTVKFAKNSTLDSSRKMELSMN